MLIAIHQPNYLPRLKVVAKLLQADLVVYLDDVQFVKREWQNRASIQNAGGRFQWLSVPVRTKSQQTQQLRDCQIVHDTPWERKHVSSIAQSYSRSPWRQLFHDHFASLWDTPRQYLADLCIDSTERLAMSLGHPLSSVRASDLIGTTGADIQEVNQRRRANLRLIALCGITGATGYLSGTGALAYLDARLFNDHSLPIFVQSDDHRDQVSWRRLSALHAILSNGPDDTIERIRSSGYRRLE